MSIVRLGSNTSQEIEDLYQSVGGAERESRRQAYSTQVIDKQGDFLDVNLDGGSEDVSARSMGNSVKTQQKQASVKEDRRSANFGGFYEENGSEEAHSGNSGSGVSSKHRHSEVNAPQSQVLDTSIDAEKSVPKPRRGSEKKIPKRRSMADVGGSEIEIKVDLGQAKGNFVKKDAKPKSRPVVTKPEDFMKIENGEV